MRRLIAGLARIVTTNAGTLVGSSVAVSALLVFLVLVGASVAGFNGGPYFGIALFLILPLVFLSGIAIAGFGLWKERRAAWVAGEVPPSWRDLLHLPPQGERRNPGFLLFASFTILATILLTYATYQGERYLGSDSFCQDACHDLMEPHAVSFLRSPHARIGCLRCHGEGGARGWVSAKFTGVRHVVSALSGRFDRPIRVLPGREDSSRTVCTECHDPTREVEDPIRTYVRFQDDERNSEQTTPFRIRVGRMEKGRFRGIHWHSDPAVRIRYLSDASRTVIRRIEVRDRDGKTTAYVTNATAPERGDLRWNEMGCVDCHSQAGHLFRTVDEEIDAAFADGRLDPSVPFLRRKASAILKSESPFQKDVTVATQVVEVLSAIRSKNVFPAMNVGWGTYPDFSGHTASPGCFRCHNGGFTGENGKTIPDDCNLCHYPASDESRD